ncbi:MAG TPA: cupin domain-containing protein [Gaiellaceae bacterium]|nr:cupin domain-containing protein [Gaiellaceae bacterium]
MGTTKQSAAAVGRRAEEAIFLPAGKGRTYVAGPMHAVFKADGAETDDRYCVSEWWLEAGRPGPGPHAHAANEELFYVLEGTMSFLVGAEWVDAACGSFLRIPAGTTHDFANRGTVRAGVLNVFIPGGFETMMPRIVAHLAEPARGEA